MCFPLTSESPTFPNDKTQITDIALIKKGGGKNKKSFSKMNIIFLHLCFLSIIEQLQLIGGWVDGRVDALHLNQRKAPETMQFLMLVKKKRTRKDFLALNFQVSRMYVDQGNMWLTKVIIEECFSASV